VTGKYNDKFRMNLYASIPVFDTNHVVKRPDNNFFSLSNINIGKALVVIDGTIANRDTLHSINPGSIDNVTALKAEDAKAIYGNAAKNGAILITTKQALLGGSLYATQDENIHYTPFAWIGIHYEKTISNNLSSDEKEASYKDFANQSRADVVSKDLSSFVYLDRINYSEDFKGYISAVKNDSYYKSFNTVSAIVFSPVNEPFEARNGQKLFWIFGSFGIGSVVFLLILVFVPIHERTSLEKIKEKQKKEDVSATKFFQSVLFPRKGYAVTPILINLNVLIFIIMALSGLGFISFSASDLLHCGGNYRPYIDERQYWRLFTAMFLHGGVMHVLFNMYGLLMVGIFLEPKIGRTRFLLAYIVTGIAASIASVWWHPATVSVGASGAIFGMYGVFLALLTVNVFPNDSKKVLLINAAIFVGYNLIFGLVGSIDNAAHIGGLLSGIVVGYILYFTLDRDIGSKESASETENILMDLNETSDVNNT